MYRYYKLKTNSPNSILAALCQEQHMLTTRRTQELLKIVQHLANYLQTFGIKVVSDLTHSCSQQGCDTDKPLTCTRDLDSLLTPCPETESLSHKLSEKTLEDQLASPGYRGPEEGCDAKHTYFSEVGTANKG